MRLDICPICLVLCVLGERKNNKCITIREKGEEKRKEKKGGGGGGGAGVSTPRGLWPGSEEAKKANMAGPRALCL